MSNRFRCLTAMCLIFILSVNLGFVSFSQSKGSDWAAEAIRELDELGILSDQMKEDYSQQINRVVFTELIVSTLEAMTGEALPYREGQFKYLDTSNPSVIKATNVQIIGGIGYQLFDPNGFLTREQAATIFSRTLSYLDEMAYALRKIPIVNEYEKSSFADGDVISSWAIDGVAHAYANQLITGVGGNRFDPKGKLTVEQAITMAHRLYENFRDINATSIGLGDYSIKNPFVEEAVRARLDKPSGAFNKEDFDAIEHLHIVYSKDNDYSDLLKFKNLYSLHINMSNLKDIEFLKGLTSIIDLDISKNQVVDLTPLQYLPNLRRFNGGFNPIKTVEPVLELSHIEDLYLWQNLELEDLQRLNENEKIGMGSFVSLDHKAEYLASIDKDNEHVRLFFKDLPKDSDALTRFMYTYSKLSRLPLDVYPLGDNWLGKINTGPIELGSLNFVFSTLLNYAQVYHVSRSEIAYDLVNEETSNQRIGFIVFDLNGNTLYTSADSDYYLLSDSKVFSGLTGKAPFDFSKRPAYEVQTSVPLSSYDFGIHAYAYGHYDRYNYYKKDNDLFVFRSFDNLTAVFDLKNGPGKSIQPEWKNWFSSYIAFDGNYGLYNLIFRELYRYDLKTGEQKMIHDSADFVYVYKDKLVFADYSKDIGLYVSNLDGSNKTKIHNGIMNILKSGTTQGAARNIVYYAPYETDHQELYFNHRYYDLDTGQSGTLSQSKIALMPINNYIITWEKDFTNFKIMKNDGTQVKAIPGLKSGQPVYAYPVGDRLFLSQNNSFVELKNSEYMPDFLYFSDINGMGK